MMSGNPPDMMIHYLAHSLASDVIGFAAKRLSEMADAEIAMVNWGKEESALFMQVYLSHLNDAYKMQIKAIKKLQENKNGECDSV